MDNVWSKKGFVLSNPWMTGHFVCSFTLLMYFRPSLFLNTIGQDWTLLTFMKLGEKKLGGGVLEREKRRPGQEPFHNTGPLIGRRKKSNFVGFSKTNSQKNSRFSRNLAEKLRWNFAKKQSLKNGQFRGNLLGYKAISFASISRTFLMKQDSNFANFWGGEKWWALASAITTETLTTYKCCLFKPGDFGFKTTACFVISFGLGILSHSFFFFYQRSSFASLTTMGSEMCTCQWQRFS